MSSLLLLLPLLCRSASGIVNHRGLIQTLTQNLASRASFALHPVGCHHFPYSDAPASVISSEGLRSGRLPRRVITAIRDCSPHSCQMWWHGYTTRRKYCGSSARNIRSLFDSLYSIPPSRERSLEAHPCPASGGRPYSPIFDEPIHDLSIRSVRRMAAEAPR